MVKKKEGEKVETGARQPQGETFVAASEFPEATFRTHGRIR